MAFSSSLPLLLRSLRRSPSSPSSPSSQITRCLHSISSSLIPSSSTTFHLVAPPPPLSRNQQICGFRSTIPSSLAARYGNNNYNDVDEKIDENTILFEGCDYNHWLITMDFPKDPKPTPEQMVETYVQTLAKVVGSVEEAKKRMYACSTTTYNGFQAVMTEEMSEKFKGLPGVVFILPDSYIDPVNKKYGGDEYDNGVITPRPPPVQYGRTGGRYNDRNRGDYGRPRDGPPRNFVPSPNTQGDGRNYGAQQSYQPQQNFGPNQSYQPQQNFGPNQSYPPQQNFGPNQTGRGAGRRFEAQQNFVPQQSYGPSQTGQGERGHITPNRDYVPGGRDSYQGEQGNPMPSYQREFPQAGRSDYTPPENRDVRGDTRNFSPSAAGDYRQGTGSSFGQNYPGRDEGQRLPQMEQRDAMQGEQQGFTPSPRGQLENDQGRD